MPRAATTRRRAQFLAVAGAVLLLLAPGSAAADGDWPFPDEHRSRLVFVHPLVNYALHPSWQREWERHLAARSGLRITSGSVATDDLATDLVVNLTEPLAGGWRFLYRGVWRDGLHLDRGRDEHWIGLESRVMGPLSAYLQVHPAPDKEEFSLATGLLLTGGPRERYLRLGARWDDFLHERKNDRGDLSDAEPVAVTWELRQTLGAWEIFSAGSYGSGSRRRFPEADLSPGLAASFRREGAATARLRHVRDPRNFAGLGVAHYRFQAADEGRGGTEGFDYTNETVHLRGEFVADIGRPWAVRAEAHWLRQWAAASGRREFAHRRQDFFPAIFLELDAPGRSFWELGYMTTWYGWEYGTPSGTDDRDGFTDKIELSWTCAFRPDARIQFSLSHERDLERFGGGNVQFQMLF